MTVRTLGPEPSASTNSATRAKCFYMIMKILTLVNTAGADFLGFPRADFRHQDSETRIRSQAAVQRDNQAGKNNHRDKISPGWRA